MNNLIKKNQLMITALAIMLAIAGYLQFAGSSIEDEYLSVDNEGVLEVSDLTGVISDNYTADIISLDTDDVTYVEDYLAEEMADLTGDADEGSMVANASENTDELAVNSSTDGELNGGEIPGESVFTSANAIAMVSEAKLLKEQTRAKNKETLMEIINSDGLSDEQKQTAVDNMVRLTTYAEQEAAAEILLEAKGFTDVVVSVSENAVDVIVYNTDLTDAKRAQIEDVISRKTDIPVENIVISTVVQ